MLNQHLQDNAAMKSDLKLLQDKLNKAVGKIDELESTINNNKKLHHKLATSVGALQKRK